MTSLQMQRLCSRPHHFLRAALVAFAFSVATVMSGPAFTATITVTGTGDTVAVDGIVTLREAIVSINAGISINADVVPVGAYGTADTINFNIAGAGVQIIAPAPFLPTITKPIIINGYSQPGSSPNTNGAGLGTNAVLLIELNMAGGHALTLSGGNSTVRGLVINRSHLSAGIDLTANSGYTIAGNFIGTNPAGTAAGPGNDNSGININATNTTIGGLAPADRNLISGNSTNGIVCCAAGVSSTVIQNNLIGTNAAGTAALGNTSQGITMSGGTGNTIGSTSPTGRNVIAASGQFGITIGSSNNTVEGNYVGTDVTGTVALPNGATGINLSGGNNTIGGTAPGAGNLVSGNVLTGITLNNQVVAGNLVQGNLIGTNAAGTAAIAGHSTAAVNVGPFVNGNTIGGTAAGAGNVIAFATGNGVRADGQGATGGTGNGILGNRIFGNNKLGIKLGTNTSDIVPTANDAGDPDTGPNTLQNYPVLTSAAIVGANVGISGTLNSTPGTLFRVELFSSVACDASGNGEGQSFLGSTNVTTDGGGNIGFGPVTFPIPAGQRQITATATNPTNNTSEFSQCILATGPPALQSAASRKVHGPAGPFDLPLTLLPLTNPTTEPRQGATATIVMTFDAAIISANVAVTEGPATVGAVTFSGNDVIVPLSGVVNQQYVTISATNVASATNTGGSGTVRIGFLIGDVNGSRAVTVADLGLVNAQLAQVVTAANFTKDINTSGTLTVADKGIANANLAKALPAP